MKVYDARLDSKKRTTIRNPKYEYYHVTEKENRIVVLEPRQLVDPHPNDNKHSYERIALSSIVK